MGQIQEWLKSDFTVSNFRDVTRCFSINFFFSISDEQLERTAFFKAEIDTRMGEINLSTY